MAKMCMTIIILYLTLPVFLGLTWTLFEYIMSKKIDKKKPDMEEADGLEESTT